MWDYEKTSPTERTCHLPFCEALDLEHHVEVLWWNRVNQHESEHGRFEVTESGNRRQDVLLKQGGGSIMEVDSPLVVHEDSG